MTIWVLPLSASASIGTAYVSTVRQTAARGL